jgi:acetyltransferase-like isoleucine patch superfamily enzyme
MIRSFGRRVSGALRRDRDLPLHALAWKILRNAGAFASGRVCLRGCDAVGPRSRCFGRLDVANEGRITIGADFAASGAFVPVRLATSSGGTIEIGDEVAINYGTCVSSRSTVKIGSRVKVGPHCILSDGELPLPISLPDDAAEPRSIVIGDDVWLGARVVIQPGVRIGEGAVISAGSLVDVDIPPHAIASGIPARVLRVAEPPPAAPQSQVRERESSPRGASAAVA